MPPPIIEPESSCESAAYSAEPAATTASTPIAARGLSSLRIGLSPPLSQIVCRSVGRLRLARAAAADQLVHAKARPAHHQARQCGKNRRRVSLAQIFNQLDKDSRLYCSGGWDQRIGRLGFRKCYRFSFSPVPVYNMTICAHDQRTAQFATSDQLLALQYFEQRFSPLECFKSVRRGANDYDIVPGKDSHFRTLQFSGSNPQDVAFCGCSAKEEQEIATAIGARFP